MDRPAASLRGDSLSNRLPWRAALQKHQHFAGGVLVGFSETQQRTECRLSGCQYNSYQFHDRGQKVTSTDDVQLVCEVGARIGASHFSYCTNADTLRS
jgi:hypothetical protein